MYQFIQEKVVWCPCNISCQPSHCVYLTDNQWLYRLHSYLNSWYYNLISRESKTRIDTKINKKCKVWLYLLCLSSFWQFSSIHICLMPSSRRSHQGMAMPEEFSFPYPDTPHLPAQGFTRICHPSPWHTGAPYLSSTWN